MRFSYKALSDSGEVVAGEIEAQSKEEVVEELEKRGFLPLVIKKERKKISLSLSWGKRIKSKDFLIFTQSLATLLKAGVPLDRALRITADILGDSPMGEVVREILRAVKEGSSLSFALARYKKIFPPLYINAVQAGEASGALSEVMSELARYYQRFYEFRNNIISSLIYPVLLFGVSVLSLAVLIIFVVPRFETMFATLNLKPPLPLRIAGFTGKMVAKFWWVGLILVVLFYLLFRFKLKTPEGKLWLDEKILKTPLLKEFVIKLENARFSRTFGTLLKNGVSILQALLISKEIVANEIIKRNIELLYIGIREGDKLANLLMAQKTGWHPVLVSMVSIGEESGELPEMLLKAADMLERDVEDTLKRLVSLVEPATIIVMGLLVGSIIVSMLVAIFSINEMVF
ncbi:MAG: type II secretion system F family protein [Deferribacteres bacterium]|nr:type II secretion system F family protein [Deferribacteres bacterium]